MEWVSIIGLQGILFYIFAIFIIGYCVWRLNGGAFADELEEESEQAPKALDWYDADFIAVTKRLEEQRHGKKR